MLIKFILLTRSENAFFYLLSASFVNVVYKCIPICKNKFIPICKYKNSQTRDRDADIQTVKFGVKTKAHIIHVHADNRQFSIRNHNTLFAFDSCSYNVSDFYSSYTIISMPTACMSVRLLDIGQVSYSTTKERHLLHCMDNY